MRDYKIETNKNLTFFTQAKNLKSALNRLIHFSNDFKSEIKKNGKKITIKISEI